jgi:hypothetical protein
MDTPKFDLKLFLHDASSLDLQALIPVLHRWIQTRALDDVLIDVVDYRHVPYGPGVILIGHDAQYGIDNAVAGRTGLLYSRRRETHASRAGIEGIQGRLKSVFHDALSVCRLLETDSTLQGQFQFRTDELLLRVNDRLQAPNTFDAFENLHAQLEPFVQQLYASDAVKVEHLSDPMSSLTVTIKAACAVPLGAMLTRLDEIEIAVGV